MKRGIRLVALVLLLLSTVLLIVLARSLSTISIDTIEAQETSTYGGILRLARREPPHLNPILNWTGWGSMWYWDITPITDLLFNSLVKWNETLDIDLDLADSWEVSPSGKNYTFYLKPGIRWHDGVELTSDDVKYTFETIMNYSDSICSEYYKYAGLSNIDSIATNDLTVVFNLKNASAPFLSKIAHIKIVPKHCHNMSTNWIPIGTGLFNFTERVPGSHVKLSANLDYFETRPYLDGVLFDYTILQKTAAWGADWEALANNQIDIVSSMLNPKNITYIQSIAGKTVETASDLAIHFLGINCREEPLNKTKVRQAIAYAINTTRIIETVYLGYAENMTGPVHPECSFWYNPDVPTYEQNQTLAEEYLNEEGYPQVGEWRFNLTLKTTDSSWDELRLEAAKLIKEDLEAVGIGVELQSLSFPTIWTEVYVNHDFDITNAMAWELSNDPDYLYDLFHSSDPMGYNPWGFTNNTLNDLLEQQRVEMNITERKEIVDKIQWIYAWELPTIPLYHKLDVNAYNNDFYNFLNMPGMFATIRPLSLKNVTYSPTISAQGKSDVYITMIDPEGRKAGWDEETQTFVTEIPGSVVVEDQCLVKLPNPKMFLNSTNTSIEIIVRGKKNETYKLECTDISLSKKEVFCRSSNIKQDEEHRYRLYLWPTYDPQLRLWWEAIIYHREIAMPDGKVRTIVIFAPAYNVSGENYDTRHCRQPIPR